MMRQANALTAPAPEGLRPSANRASKYRDLVIVVASSRHMQNLVFDGNGSWMPPLRTSTSSPEPSGVTQCRRLDASQDISFSKRLLRS